MVNRAFMLMLCIFLQYNAFAADPSSSEVMIDNFESGQFLWNSRSDLKKVKEEYKIMTEGSNHFMRGAPTPGDEGKVALIQHKINLKETPFLNWRWRIQTHPKVTGASSVGDNAACVYVHFKTGFFGHKSTILKYCWAAMAKESAWINGTNNVVYEIKTKVLRQGGPLNEWLEESVNIRDDFKAAFGKTPPNESQGVGILTDGDSTSSISIGDYDDFSVTPQAKVKVP